MDGPLPLPLPDSAPYTYTSTPNTKKALQISLQQPEQNFRTRAPFLMILEGQPHHLRNALLLEVNQLGLGRCVALVNSPSTPPGPTQLGTGSFCPWECTPHKRYCT